jgi:chromosome segregation ATPase
MHLRLAFTWGTHAYMSPTEYEELVEFLGRQFTEIDRHFERIDQRFERIDQRFERIDQRFERIDQRFERIDQRFDLVAGRFDQIDRRFDVVDGQIADLRREMLGHFDELYRRLERLEQEYHAITQGLRRIEAGLADESGRREILARDLAELKQQVAALQSRIADIEVRLSR